MGSICLYLGIFFTSAGFANNYQKHRLKHNERRLFFYIINYFLILSIPIFFSTVRNNVGTDIGNYQTMFTYFINKDIIELWSNNEIEILYILLNKAAYILFGSNFLGLLFLVSLLITFFALLGLESFIEDINIGSSLLIFYILFFSLSFNIMRQTIAIAIIFYSYTFLLEKKIVKYAFWVIVATLFHRSAFLCLGYIFIVFFNFKTKKGNLNFLLSSLKYIVIGTFFLISGFLIDDVLHISILNKYQTYSIDLSQGGLGFLLNILPYLLPILIFKKNILLLGQKYSILIDVAILQIIFGYLGYYNQYMSRLTLFSSSAQIILVPLLIRCFNNVKEKSIVAAYYIMVYLYYYFVHVYSINQGNVFPYRWIF